MTNDARAQAWAQVLSAQADSGLSKKAFCAEHQINVATFYYWQKRFREATQASSAGFTRVQVVDELQLTICLAKGDITLRSECIDTLAQVILALGNA